MSINIYDCFFIQVSIINPIIKDKKELYNFSIDMLDVCVKTYPELLENILNSLPSSLPLFLSGSDILNIIIRFEQGKNKTFYVRNYISINKELKILE